MNNSPPLFVRAFKGGHLAESTLVHRSGGLHIKGLFECDVCAPNGARAYGQVKFDLNDPPDISYEKLLRLLIVFGRAEHLWIDPGHEVAPKNSIAAGVIAWANGEPLQPSEWKLDPIGETETVVTFVVRASQQIEYLQLWTEPGPSLCVRLSEPYFALGLYEGRAGPFIRPIAVGYSGLADAYWGFLRHDCQEAAYQLGRGIVDASVINDDAQEIGSHLALVSAHWQARFGSDDPRKEYSILHHLGNDVDAKLMRWMLSFDDPNTFEVNEFSIALERIRQDRPHFTETLRLFCERLSAAAAACNQLGQLDTIDGDVRWVRRLAASTYWDSGLTTYRALRPDEPDPGATSASLATSAKKKSPRLSNSVPIYPSRI